MARIVPTASRIDVAREPGRLRITAKVRRNWFIVIFLSGWLGGWAMGETFAIKALASGGTPGGASAFLVFWLIAWTAGGGAAIYSLLWNLVGREEITLDGRTLTVRLGAAGLGRSREYDLSAITNLRAEPASNDLLRYTRTTPWASSGAIAFDYGAKTHRLGISLDGQDVQTAVEAIKERLPAAARGW